MGLSIYEIVTNEIIKKLDNGVIPWRKPWGTKRGECAHNWTSGRAYTGFNAMMLDAGEYATFKQIQESGGNVKKGEHGSIVTFYKLFQDEKDENKKIPFLRYYKVFEINTQCEGLKSKKVPIPNDTRPPVEQADAIIAKYTDAPKVEQSGIEACYISSLDVVQMPKRAVFPQLNEYYCALFHELVHSTGHKKRLARHGITGTTFFGNEEYSKEELVAEIGAAMLCSISGIGFNTLDNSVSYINSWLRKLKSDPKLIVIAAGQAQKAADYIQGLNQ